MSRGTRETRKSGEIGKTGRGKGYIGDKEVRGGREFMGDMGGRRVKG